MLSDSTLLIASLSIVTMALLAMYIPQQKIKERYQDVFYAKDYAKGNWVSRPSFRADLAPRFDSTRYGGYVLGTFPGIDVQGAPLTPVGDIAHRDQSTYSYLNRGVNSAYGPSVNSVNNIPINDRMAAPGSNMPSNMNIEGYRMDPRLPQGGLTTSQVNNILSNKFGTNMDETKTYLGNNYQTREPDDSSTFMYDRYIFANNKRRYGKVGADHVRGDIPIEQVRMGWFDPNPVAKQDIVSGYMTDYMDIKSNTTESGDVLFERNPNRIQSDLPYSRLAEQTVYSVL